MNLTEINPRPRPKDKLPGLGQPAPRIGCFYAEACSIFLQWTNTGRVKDGARRPTAWRYEALFAGETAGGAVRLQREKGVVRADQGSGQYMIWEIAK